MRVNCKLQTPNGGWGGTVELVEPLGELTFRATAHPVDSAARRHSEGIVGELLLLAALAWPPECLIIGDMYRLGAEIRDAGHPLERALSVAQEPRIKRMLIHVYQRRDMSPAQWKWFVIGACVAHRDHPKGTSV